MIKNNIIVDIHADIIPEEGLGGISFSNHIQDFESYQVINNCVELADGSIIVRFDKDTQRVCSITCTNSYLGKLFNGIGIGSSMMDALEKDEGLGFNLDTDAFDRILFDGLVIYPPTTLISNQCVDAAVKGLAVPDFKITMIELIDIDFAKKHFEDVYIIFKGDKQVSII